jgi:integrase
MQIWLSKIRNKNALNTYTSYKNAVENAIIPYFKARKIHLSEINLDTLGDYYDYMVETRGKTANTVKHHHTLIRKALKQAFLKGVISGNPADLVELPKDNDRFEPSFYDADQLNELFRASRGHTLELPILVAAFYGFRRSELLGLRWSAVNFKEKTISVERVIVNYTDDDGKVQILSKKNTTSTSGRRVLPLVPQIESALMVQREEQRAYMRLCGKSYSDEFKAYIFVDRLGDLLKPDYVSATFRKLLKNNNLSPIRFHDLRHSCASLLLANGIDMKRIQEWLGHSSMSTTARFYAHLKADSKNETAYLINKVLESPAVLC